MQYRIQVGFLFRAYAVTADFAVRYRLEIQSRNQLVHCCVPREVGLVPKHKKRDPLHCWLVQEYVHFLFGDGKGFLVG